MGTLAFGVAWALAFAAGISSLRALGRRDLWTPEGVGLGLLLGATWTAVLAAALSLFQLVGAATLGGALAIVAALAWQRGSKRAALDAAPQEPTTTRDWATFLPALLVVGLTLFQAFGRPVYNVDAQRRWVLRAQATAAEGTLVPTSFTDEALATSHPSYPPLVPALAALALTLGADRDTGMRPGFPLFLFALLGVLHGFVRRRAGPSAALLLTSAVALTPALGLTDQLGLGAAAAHADVALAAFLTALAVLVLEAERPASLPLIAAVALGAVWTKNEGMAFVLVMGVTTLVVNLRTPRGLRASATLLASALVGIVLWKWLARDMPVAPGEDYVSGGILAVLAANLERLPTILERLGAEFLTWRLWGLAWLAVPVALALGLARRAPRGFWLLALWLAAGIALVVAAYVATGWKDNNYSVLMEVSLARLIAHHVPLAFLMWAYLLAPRAEAGE